VVPVINPVPGTETTSQAQGASDANQEQGGNKLQHEQASAKRLKVER